MNLCLRLIPFVGYHYDLQLRSRGSYILVGIWCLMAVVLFKFIYFLFDFLSASSGVEKMIGDSLRANPENSFSTMAEAKKKLSTGYYALIYVIFFEFLNKIMRMIF